jgi:hypothetical protein
MDGGMRRGRDNARDGMEEMRVERKEKERIPGTPAAPAELITTESLILNVRPYTVNSEESFTKMFVQSTLLPPSNRNTKLSNRE